MLEPDFQLPDKKISTDETKKRLNLVNWFSDYIKPSVSGLIISGSLSYGQNYSVKPTSDIDMQLLVNPENVKELVTTNCFDFDELIRAVKGYESGLFRQFSLTFKKDNIPMECHFWDERAFIEAITFKNENTKRLRSSVETPSTDFGYAFDREENVKDYFGEISNGYAIADFPSYRYIRNKLFLCRPITNILGLPLVLIDNPKINTAIDDCWKTAVKELLNFCDGSFDLEKANIANTLPGKNKMSPEALNKVYIKTIETLKAITS